MQEGKYTVSYEIIQYKYKGVVTESPSWMISRHGNKIGLIRWDTEARCYTVWLYPFGTPIWLGVWFLWSTALKALDDVLSGERMIGVDGRP